MLKFFPVPASIQYVVHLIMLLLSHHSGSWRGRVSQCGYVDWSEQAAMEYWMGLSQQAGKLELRCYWINDLYNGEMAYIYLGPSFLHGKGSFKYLVKRYTD